MPSDASPRALAQTQQSGPTTRVAGPRDQGLADQIRAGPAGGDLAKVRIGGGGGANRQQSGALTTTQTNCRQPQAEQG